jgi:hypothetical protein
MTDKELSMKFVLNYPKIEKGELLTTMDLQNAFLAGLKTGRLKWHDLRKDPHDLPKHCKYGTRTSEHVLVKFKSGNTGVCYFDFDLLGWFANGYLEQLKNIIAWCEVPKYTEE